VSSPGLDQPFKVKQQYEKNIGRSVKVVLNSHGSQEGVLKSVSEKTIVLEWEEKERIEGRKKQVLVSKTSEIEFEDIKETKVVITFK
jgi:ribosome maturation factor RimP